MNIILKYIAPLFLFLLNLLIFELYLATDFLYHLPALLSFNALILLCIGYFKNYKYISYISLFVLALSTIAIFFFRTKNIDKFFFLPFNNMFFYFHLTTIVCLATYYYLINKYNYKFFSANKFILIGIKYSLLVVIILILYFTLYNEIEFYFIQKFYPFYLDLNLFDSEKDTQVEKSIIYLKNLSLIYYSFIFLVIISFTSLKKHHIALFYFYLIIFICIFTLGNYYTSELMLTLNSNKYIEDHPNHMINFWIRYVNFSFIVANVMLINFHIKKYFKQYKKYSKVLIYLSIFLVLAIEIEMWLNLFKNNNSIIISITSSLILFCLSYGVYKLIKMKKIIELLIIIVVIIYLTYEFYSYYN